MQAGVAHSISARPSELEGRSYDRRHSIDVCLDFLLFCSKKLDAILAL